MKYILIMLLITNGQVVNKTELHDTLLQCEIARNRHAEDFRNPLAGEYDRLTTGINIRCEKYIKDTKSVLMYI